MWQQANGAEIDGGNQRVLCSGENFCFKPSHVFNDLAASKGL